MIGHRRGFTTIELAITISIIAVIVSIVLVAYNAIQQQARDTKRRGDISVLAAQFEKYYDTHGAYPTGCSQFTAANASYCRANNAVVTTDSPAFYSDTTIDQLRAVFPALANDFGDPIDDRGYPFGKHNYGFSPHYFYIGQYVSTITGGQGGGVIGSATGSEVDCKDGKYYWLRTPGGSTPQYTTYVLGYWSENTSQWFIYWGQHGEPLTNDAGAPVRHGTSSGRCVFV